MLNKLKRPIQSPQQKNRRKLSKQAIVSIAACAFLVMTHIAIILAIILSFRYYSIYPSLFGSIVGIVLCLLIIVDIVFFVGFNHKDLALKIVSCTLSLFLLVGGTVGSYFISKANVAVNGVLDDGSSTKYETYSGVFVSYDKYNTFTSLEDLQDKRIGMLTETTDGISYIAKSLLSEAKIDYAEIDYNTNTELMVALIDNDVDAIVITSAYRNIYSLERDENSPFAQYLSNLVDFDSFEQELKVKTSKTKKNLSTDPFNVLLIGYSRTDIGSSVGLADSIIVATINPQTYTVSMMSIARDSFVPISCYGGEYDKINSGRSTSRACFIETVEDFLDMDIDYYMELDYLGLVQIVNVLGGIYINNPVTFTLDGITVPAGENVFADGQMALQFCRERHSMPNGDFDRQQHQKEVIIAIAKKLIESRDINVALECMEAASNWMSTDMTLSELTQVFNLLLNTKNYTGMDTFDLIDFETLRMTGSGGTNYYSYDLRLPLWVYLIYKGSYDESMEHLNEVMGNYESIEQEYSFSFSALDPYERPALYSTSYPEEYMYTPDPMPAYWANLVGMTQEEAEAWASENGVSLSIEYIFKGEEGYNEEYEGLVADQSVRYGNLISEDKYGSVTIMIAQVDEDKVVPDFVGHNYEKAIDWADDHDIDYDINFSTDVDGEVGDVVSQSPKAYTDIEKCDELEITVKAGTLYIKFDKNGHGSDSELPKTITTITGDKAIDISNYTMTSVDESGNVYNFVGWYTSKDSTGTKITSTNQVGGSDGSTVTLYAHWAVEYTVTLDATTNGGTCGKASVSTTGTLPDASKTHFAFSGWYTSASGGDKVTDLTTLTGPTTLYAQFEAADWTETISDANTANSTYGCALTNDSGQKLDSCTVTGNGDTQNSVECKYIDDVQTNTVECSYESGCIVPSDVTDPASASLSCTKTTTTVNGGTPSTTCACTVTSTE